MQHISNIIVRFQICQANSINNVHSFSLSPLGVLFRHELSSWDHESSFSAMSWQGLFSPLLEIDSIISQIEI
jgi:hypothetical protein